MRIRVRLLRKVSRVLANPVIAAEIVAERVGSAYWRAEFCLRCALRGTRVGARPDVFGRCVLRKGLGSEITLGDSVQIISSNWRSSTASCTSAKLRTFYPTSKIIIGDNSGMTGGAIVARSKTIRIGRQCMLAPNVTIMDSDFHIAWPPERRHNTSATDIDEGYA